jgi:predicted RecB family nuclease
MSRIETNRSDPSRWVRYKPTDLAAMLSCDHLVTLERRAHAGEIERVYFDDPIRELLQLRGQAHEQKYLTRLEANGLTVRRIADDATARHSEFWARGYAATTAAMREGADIVYQAPLVGAGYSGIADFLVKVPNSSEFGPWSYEVLDAKLSAETKARTVLQLCLYSELVGVAQGRVPEHFQVLPGGATEPEIYALKDFTDFYKDIRRAFERAAISSPAVATYPEPVEYCSVCSWRGWCEKRRRDDDHLSLIPRITRRQRRILGRNDVSSVESLAALASQSDAKLEGIPGPSFDRLRHQARLLFEGRGLDVPKHEWLDLEPKRGLNALPEPNHGDVYLDLEADHYAIGGGLEYLFGMVTLDGGEPKYHGYWARNATEEKRAFEQVVDFLNGRDLDYPGFRVYHYGAYEEAAFKRLMYRHGVKDREVDDFLRRELFVDVGRIVLQSLRASVESYSLKQVERLCRFQRSVPVSDATRASKSLLLALEQGGDAPAEAAVIEKYNRDDCLALAQVHRLLEARRAELVTGGHKLERPTPSVGAPSEGLEEYLTTVERLRRSLLLGFPENPLSATPEQKAKRLLADVLEFHRREDNASAWQYFEWRRLTNEQLIAERGPIGGMTFEDIVGKVAKSQLYRYRFPPQEHSIRAGSDVVDPSTGRSPGDVHAVNDVEGYLDLKRGPKAAQAPHPISLLPDESRVLTRDLRQSLVRIAERTIENGMATSCRDALAYALLMRRPPTAGALDGELTRAGEDALATAKRIALDLAGEVLPIQGPPGSGKTYVGARMIKALLERGKRVGISAHSHRAICNLLTELHEAGFPSQATAAQAASDDDYCRIDAVKQFPTSGDLAKAISTQKFQLVAGTPWLWAREAMHEDPVDVMFIDEAGQMSLANAIAISPAAHAIVLLGDPQQLSQPQKAIHPPGAGTSTLEHLLAGAATIGQAQGLFLGETYRMPSGVRGFISDSFYDGRLTSASGVDAQQLVGDPPFSGAGIVYVPVKHEANQSTSPEEIAAVTQLIARLLAGHPKWVDRDGRLSELEPKHILVVAPYNLQVEALVQHVGQGVRVGTVDKFQGQQAPVVIYSMTSSTIEDAPRGMDFVMSANRFNVAISRARCLAILVANPELLRPRCRTPDQMRLANAFSRFLARASRWDIA